MVQIRRRWFSSRVGILGHSKALMIFLEHHVERKCDAVMMKLVFAIFCVTNSLKVVAASKGKGSWNDPKQS